jgi:hypothetical protein
MDVPAVDAPRVRIKGNGIVRLLAWERREDGWWAIVQRARAAQVARSYGETIELYEDAVPATQVTRLDGEDYSHVPRRTDLT